MPIATDPHAAMAQVVDISAGQVNFLGAKVRAIDEGERCEEATCTHDPRS